MMMRSGYLFQRGKTWYVRYMVNGKVFSLSTGETTKKEALKARRRIMTPVAVGHQADVLAHVAAKLGDQQTQLALLHDEKHPPLRVADAWVAFKNSPVRPDCGPVTLASYGYQWARFVEWNEKRAKGAALRDLNAASANLYASNLAASKMSPSTFNKHRDLLALVFRVLEEQGRLTGNPWLKIPRKRHVSHSRRELTVDELRSVCHAAKGELRILLALGVYTGLRLGDCATLRWDETDLVRGIIRRIPNKTARRNPRPVLVPIHTALLALLTDTAEDARRGSVLPDTAKLYRIGRYRLTAQIQGHFRACKIETSHQSGGVRATVDVGFHSLRHTFVSLCRAANAPLSVVESIVGHASPAMTRHYTHTGEDAARLAVESLPSLEEGKALLLPTAEKTRDPVPAWVREIIARIQTALTAGDLRAARAEVATLAAEPTKPAAA